jgi:hypothetical protein
VSSEANTADYCGDLECATMLLKYRVDEVERSTANNVCKHTITSGQY